jgi:hypothetical protein
MSPFIAERIDHAPPELDCRKNTPCPTVVRAFPDAGKEKALDGGTQTREIKVPCVTGPLSTCSTIIVALIAPLANPDWAEPTTTASALAVRSAIEPRPIGPAVMG